MTPTGALMMGFFATIWWVVSLRAAGHAPALVGAVPVVVAVALWTRFSYRGRQRGAASGAGNAPGNSTERRRGRLVGWASAAVGVAVLVAVNVLANTGHPQAIAPVIVIMVGAHFVPIAHWWPARGYYITGAGLVVVGFVGLLIGELSTRLTLVGVGAAAVLWLTAWAALPPAGKGDTLELRAPAS